MKTRLLRLIAFAVVALGITSAAFAQGTAFTYQGRLNDGAAPANGTYDLTFALHGAVSGPAQVGAALTNSATLVSNGLFTVSLDFGNQFPGANRWLEIGVRTNGAGGFTALAPRQPLTATPYAVYAPNAGTAVNAGSVAAANITGTIQAANIGAGSITSTMLANGAVTTGAIADGAVTAAKVATVSNWFPLTIANPTPAAIDYFGISVAAVGSDRVLIGAFGDDTGAADAGAAYLFSTETYTAGLVADGVHPTGITTTSLQDGAVTLAKLDPTIGVWTRSGSTVFRLDGNVGIGTANPVSALHVVGTVTATAFNPPSDRNLKENFAAVSSRDVLEKVAGLSISRWNFKGDTATPHVGPMAQDFHAAFGLGTDDRHIATVDADGVALAAIQGLNQKFEEELKQKQTEITELKARLEKLERLMNEKNGGAK